MHEFPILLRKSLYREAVILKRLAGIPGIPNAVKHYYASPDPFILLEGGSSVHADGSVPNWKKLSAFDNAKMDHYVARELIINLMTTVGAVHARGVSIRNLGGTLVRSGQCQYDEATRKIMLTDFSAAGLSTTTDVAEDVNRIGSMYR
jgi:hypothetical protein